MSILNSYKGGIFAGVLRDLSTPLKWDEIKPALDADELITKYKKSNLGPNRFLEKYPVPIKIASVASIFAGRANGTAHAGGTAPHVRTAHWARPSPPATGVSPMTKPPPPANWARNWSSGMGVTDRRRYRPGDDPPVPWRHRL